MILRDNCADTERKIRMFVNLGIDLINLDTVKAISIGGGYEPDRDSCITFVYKKFGDIDDCFEYEEDAKKLFFHECNCGSREEADMVYNAICDALSQGVNYLDVSNITVK